MWESFPSVYGYQITTYTLNILKVICPLYFNKAGKTQKPRNTFLMENKTPYFMKLRNCRVRRLCASNHSMGRSRMCHIVKFGTIQGGP